MPIMIRAMPIKLGRVGDSPGSTIQLRAAPHKGIRNFHRFSRDTLIFPSRKNQMAKAVDEMMASHTRAP